MMNGTVLDILIYVFDRYMFDEAPDVPERDELARDLQNAGFGDINVERALDWLADLANERERAGQRSGTESLHEMLCNGQTLNADFEEGAIKLTPLSLRIYSPQEDARLSAECRGLLLSLERAGILTPAQREIVIDRLLALDADDLGLQQVKWVVLMVLSSQPGQELACARMETLVFDDKAAAAH